MKLILCEIQVPELAFLLAGWNTSDVIAFILRDTGWTKVQGLKLRVVPGRLNMTEHGCTATI